LPDIESNIPFCQKAGKRHFQQRFNYGIATIYHKICSNSIKMIKY